MSVYVERRGIVVVFDLGNVLSSESLQFMAYRTAKTNCTLRGTTDSMTR